jgi:ribonuclease G
LPSPRKLIAAENAADSRAQWAPCFPKDLASLSVPWPRSQDKEALEEDMRTVLKKWERILNKLENSKPPTLLYKDLDITESLIRDLFAKQYDRVLIDDYQLYKSVKSYVSQIAPKMLPSVQLYKGKDHIFDHVNVGHDVNSIFSPRVQNAIGRLSHF